MKIAIDLRMWNSSGIGTYLQNLVPKVAARFPRVEFHLMGRKDEVKPASWKSKATLRWIEYGDPIYSLGEQWGRTRLLPKDLDLFWSPHYNIPLFYRGPLLVTVHDVFHLAMGEFAGNPLRRLYARTLFRGVARRASAVIAVSRFTKSELIRLTGLASSKVRVIPNGVDPGFFSARSASRPHAKPYWLFVGNVKPHKNLKRLFLAFERVKSRIPWDLVLVGKKEGFRTGDGEVAALAERSGGRIVLTGMVSEEKLRAYYRHAEAMVFPSLYEGFGLPPLEAMASGCPVLSSKAASLPETCGLAALYFDPLDVGAIARAMEKIAASRPLRARLRWEGSKRAKLFSWESSADKTCEVIRESLASRG